MKKALDYILVIIQFALFAIYFWQPAKISSFLPEVWKYTGIILIVAGCITTILAMIQLSKHLSMLPSPTEHAVLRTDGIYHLMRHPIYAGIIYFAIGFALYKLNFTKLLLSIVLILFFELKTIYEEKKLVLKFPDYDEYRRNTEKFFPTFLRKDKQEAKNKSDGL